MSLSFIITNAGRAALINAQHSGTNAVTIVSAKISETPIALDPATTSIPGIISTIAAVSGGPVAFDTIHVAIEDNSQLAYNARTVGLYLGDGTLFGLYSAADPFVSKVASSDMLIAVDVQLADVDATQIEFGSTNFLNPPATTDVSGVVELATVAEATAGTDQQRAVTPAGMLAAVGSWLDTRLGAGAPSAFFKSLMTAASAIALRASLGLGNSAILNIGAGNGIDADKLDGQEGAYYADIPSRLGYTPVNRLGDTMSGGLTINGGDLVAYRAGGTTGGVYLTQDKSRYLYFDGAAYQLNGAPLYINGARAWTVANDGAGSGMDSDLLDGQEGAYYANIPARLGYTPTSQDATHLGLAGGETLWNPGAVSDWGALPSGASRFVNVNRPGNPDSNFGYFMKSARRDSQSDWGGIWCGFNGGESYIGDSTGNASINWRKIWTSANFNPASYMPLAGGTSTGTITVRNPAPEFHVNGIGITNDAGYNFFRNDTLRWVMGDSISNDLWYVNRFDNNGNYAGTSLQISRTTGLVSTTTIATQGDHTVTGAVSAGSVSAAYLAASANGTGNAIRIGDDVYLGDVNYPNGVAVRGQQNFNAGYIVFGNSVGYALGCNDSDPTLRWNGQPVWHAANDGSGSGMDADTVDGRHASDFASSGDFQTGVANGINWERRPNGILEMWGYAALTSSGEPVVTITLPYSFRDSTYQVSLTPFIYGTNVNCDTWVQLIRNSKNGNSFQVQYQHPGAASTYDLDGFEFRVIGNS